MINLRKFLLGIGLVPVSASGITLKGEMEVLDSDGSLQIHNGTVVAKVATDSNTLTLTNKTIDANNNTLLNIPTGALPTGIPATNIGTGTVDNTEFGYLDGVTSPIQTQINTDVANLAAHTGASTGVHGVTGSVVGTTDTQTLSNKSLTSPTLTGTPIAPTPTAGDSTTKIATTSFVQAAVAAGTGPVLTANRAVATSGAGTIVASPVTDTELSYVGGVTSSIQTQLNNKQPLNTELTGVAANTTSGLIARTAAGAYTGRTLTGTTNTITVTNGSGVAGNPTATIADNAVLPGVASLTLPTGTTAQRPGTPVNGMTRYNTDLGVQETYQSGAWVSLGSGAGGINWISPSDGVAATGYNVYNNGSVAVPTTGTGGTATVTFGTSSTAPLHGLSSYIFTKPASNVQGQGFSKDFTIDLGYYKTPTPETISMLFSVDSGTFVTGDMTFWIYDTANAVLIQPSAYMVQFATGPQMLKMEFQPNSTSGSYRLIGHVASTSTSAFVIKLDDVSVSPNTYNAGVVVTGTQSYVPTFSGLGTVATPQIFYYRVGDKLRVTGTFVTGPSVPATTVMISVPAGLSIDTTKTGTATSHHVGFITRVGSAATFPATNSGPWPVFTDGAGGSVVYVTAAATGSFTKANGSTLFNPNELQSINFEVPILGWGTSQILSSDTDTRVVDFSSSPSPVQSIPNNTYTLITGWTAVKDSHGAFNGTSYTVPVAGDYTVGASLYWSTSSTGGRETAVYKNGSLVKILQSLNAITSAYTTGGTTLLTNLKAGDVLTIYGYQNSGGALSTRNDVGYSSFEVVRISGPAQIAASEKVYAKYRANTGTSVTAMVTNIPFVTKVNDSHGAWNGSTFTAPRAGWYDIKGMFLIAPGSSNMPGLYIDGTLVDYMHADYSTDRRPFSGGAYLNAGQVMSVRPSVTVTLNSADQTLHWIAITSQG